MAKKKKKDNEISHNIELGRIYEVDGLIVQVTDIQVRRFTNDNGYRLLVDMSGDIIEE